MRLVVIRIHRDNVTQLFDRFVVATCVFQQKTSLRANRKRKRIQPACASRRSDRFLDASARHQKAGIKVMCIGVIGIELNGALEIRSEERRVGKECRSRWSLYH